MATYEESGVNIELGDECSKIAYEAAKSTFSLRKGMIGEPIIMEGGFSGAMDFGDFYLVQNDDGIGTKMIIARQAKKYDTMGYDLVGMVADDAICIGAEVVSVSNTIDVGKVDKEVITALMEGLKKACTEQKIVVPGGEIAELGSMVNGYIWNSTAIGIVAKDKMITCDGIEPGDELIGFGSNVFRSNGISLVRHIMTEKFGDNWVAEKYNDEMTWGEAVLAPTKIYHAAVLEMIGRYKQEGTVNIKGIAHITGGGLPGNVVRILKKGGFGAEINNLPEPSDVVTQIKKFGNVDDAEAYKTWNMGIGMVLVSSEFDKIKEIAGRHGIETYKIGKVTAEPGVKVGDLQF